MPASAASILRVSTKKQLHAGDGIENQRRGNAEYIRRMGYTLAREFVVAESADGDGYDRADFEAAIAQVVANKGEFDVVVFWKVDRISRGGVLPYFTLKGVLAKHGVRVEFATEQIDDSPTGELMETLLAGMARFENRLRVDRTIGVEKILTKDGYWVRPAPTGFKNGRRDGKPVLLPTDAPGQWELLRAGLRKQASGAFTLAEVAEEMRVKGLRTREGSLMNKQTWQNVCRSPVYGGLLRGVWTDGAFVRAKFDGPLTPEEWHGLQQALDGRKRLASAAPRQGLHPAFPLRRFVRCPGCGHPVRGYHASGHAGKRYAYYDCQRPACGFRVDTGEAHAAFVRLLGRLVPSRELLALFHRTALRVWAEHVKGYLAAGEAGRASVAALEDERRRVVALMKQSVDNPALLADLERDYERVERELGSARLIGGADGLSGCDPERVADACVEALPRMADVWQQSAVEGKSRLQRLLFPDGVAYDAVTGHRTPRVSLLYALLPASRVVPSLPSSASPRSPRCRTPSSSRESS